MRSEAQRRRYSDYLQSGVRVKSRLLNRPGALLHISEGELAQGWQVRAKGAVYRGQRRGSGRVGGCACVGGEGGGGEGEQIKEWEGDEWNLCKVREREREEKKT